MMVENIPYSSGGPVFRKDFHFLRKAGRDGTAMAGPGDRDESGKDKIEDAAMTAGRGGGAARHIPVLGREAVECLRPRDGGIYIDATFGAGGYTRLMLAAADCKVIGIDRDSSAIAAGSDLVRDARGRLELIEARFSALDRVAQDAGHPLVDGIVLDIGVSSMQLDEGSRGFSFRLDGPLDMRMGASGPCAADIVARASAQDLADIIYRLGEERQSRAIARAIVAARQEAPIVTTRALAEIVARVVHMKPGAIHPATRTFQALRIFVNEELQELVEALIAAERILKIGGRIAVVSFHSLEDRIVKNFFAARGEQKQGSRHLPEIAVEAPTFSLVTKKPRAPDAQEIEENPRARSAKLRCAERLSAPAREDAAEDLLPVLPKLADIMRGA